MFQTITQKVRKAIGKIKYGHAADSVSFIRFLRHKGVAIGKGCMFYDAPSCVIDISNPTLLELGDNVRITHGVVILTHDFSWSVLAGVYGEMLGGVAPVKIGSNVFIGMNTTILKGVTIGDNVIIGAGSIVTKNIPSNEVWGGNPARRIMTLEEYYHKKQRRSREELFALCKQLKHDEATLKNALREYEPMFMDADKSSIQVLMKETGYEERCRCYYKAKEREFCDLSAILLALEQQDLQSNEP